jgi:hypothetical protein
MKPHARTARWPVETGDNQMVELPVAGSPTTILTQ